MDEITLLRTLRSEVTEPTDDELAPAFAALQAQMDGQTRRWTFTRPTRWIPAAGGVLAAAAVTTVLVVSMTTTPAVTPVPSGPAIAEPYPSAMETEPTPTAMTAPMVLATAAERTADPQDLLVSPGQVLKVQTTTESLQPWSSAASTDGDPSTFPFVPFDADADGAILWRDTRQLFVPADRTVEWTWVWNPQTIEATFGDYADQMLADAALPEYNMGRDTAGTFTAPAGNVPGRDGESSFPLDSYRPYYDEMPRDPQALLDWYRDRSGDVGAAADRWVVSSIDPLAVNLAPADLRAATFRAIGLIEGLTVTQQSGDLVTIDYGAADGITYALEVDTTHGYLRSFAQTWDEGNRSVAPGVPDVKQTVDIEVLDRAP